ncbi:MAG: hypothetical protein H0V89_08310, partial [Deltaproteobacteria bacterium]|nr:hypothetical protein [Deltaproteobacteria bacterium]
AFTARCVASAGSSVPDAIVAGLCALKGTRHGGLTALADRLLEEAAATGARAAIAGRLRRGEVVPGFGHRLYPDGDPRGWMLIERAVRMGGANAALTRSVVEGGGRSSACSRAWTSASRPRVERRAFRRGRLRRCSRSVERSGGSRMRWNRTLPGG